jgi:DNA-directed RNA polymerase subunit F
VDAKFSVLNKKEIMRKPQKQRESDLYDTVSTAMSKLQNTCRLNNAEIRELLCEIYEDSIQEGGSTDRFYERAIIHNMLIELTDHFPDK